MFLSFFTLELLSGSTNLFFMSLPILVNIYVMFRFYFALLSKNLTPYFFASYSPYL